MKRQVDHAALAVRWQREAHENLYVDDAAPLARRQPDNLVLPAPPPAALRPLPTQDHAQTIDVLPAATVQTVVRTSQVDHSRGFLIRTLPLAAAFAVAALVVTVGLLQVPLMSLRTLVVLFVVFAGVYGWAFWQDLRTSPAGIALTHTENLWRHIHAERRFRHKWYENERKELRR